jgi:RNA polymerase sigma-70 factor (ECF subfamily)
LFTLFLGPRAGVGDFPATLDVSTRARNIFAWCPVVSGRYNAARHDMPSSIYTDAVDANARVGWPPLLDQPTAGSADVGPGTLQVQAEVLRLYDACAPGLRRYVRSCGLAPEAAEDVVHEAFLALFRHLSRGGAAHNLRGWLVRVSYRQALKHRERVARRYRQELTLDDRDVGLVDPAPDPLSGLTTQQTRRRLQAVYRALPARERQCLTLRAEGLRYRDIAHTLGISLGSVAKSMARAAARLSTVVKE